MATSVSDSFAAFGMNSIRSPHMDAYERSLKFLERRGKATGGGGDTERRQGDWVDEVQSDDESFDDDM